tara:strand:- start:2 stop:955 length:954 start_codon:yes stop_codon:yes gene_type:complete
MIIKTNPEFGIELALVVPYAYWLHTQGKLDKVITSSGMKPFYYFCEDVEESFDYRTIDNEAAGMNEMPNNWIHGDNKLGTVITKPAVLNYSQWISPPYRNQYKNDKFNFDNKPIVFISNIYNFEHGSPPKYHFFDIPCLYEMFTYLTEKGYCVIYKRPTNTEGFAIDQNEMSAVHSNLNITANVEGIGNITDRELPQYLTDVYLFDDIVERHPEYTYNEIQLKIMANTDKFISVCGGNAIFSSLFGRTTLMYITQGRELRPNYFGTESYWRKLSEADIIPVFDVIKDINQNYEGDYKVNTSGTNDYTELLQKMRENF